jgi:endonuclease-3
MDEETLDQKRKRCEEIVRILKETYPDARCTLDFRTPFELLVAAILAAQSTDKKVNEITPVLFARFPTPQALAGADPAEVEGIVKPTGFFREKTRSIIGASQDIVAKHGGRVPDTMEELLELRGVGRKTANLLLGVAFGRPAIVVDTHVKRVTNRLGLSASKEPDKIERELAEVVAEKDWTIFNHLMVFHGRAICKAPTPLCEICPVMEICPYGQKRMGKR